MKFITFNSSTEVVMNANSFLVGYFKSTREKIEEVFGAPTFTTEDKWEKVTVEWVIQFEDGTTVSIYDWKRYEEGTPAMDEVYEWHIGGKNTRAAILISETMSVEAYTYNFDSMSSESKKILV